MTAFLPLLLLNLVALGLLLALAVRHPSWQASLLAAVAGGACVSAGYQMAVPRSTSVALLWPLGLDALLITSGLYVARPTPRALPEPPAVVTGRASTRAGIVNLTADPLIPEISLDIPLRKINGLADRESSVCPIYWGFSH
jgi:hypothetical protein